MPGGRASSSLIPPDKHQVAFPPSSPGLPKLTTALLSGSRSAWKLQEDV
jgi:hypothetical protein